MFAMFIAGGKGVRLWPLSREKSPKQLHSFVGNLSLITQAVERTKPVVESSKIWIVTNKNYAKQISEHLPSISQSRIITEPFPLGTNLAIGLGAIRIARNDSDAVVMIGWADSHIGKTPDFHRALRKAERLAPDFDGVILAAPVTYPATGYGYIKSGKQILNEKGVFKIADFEEKPNAERAEKLSKNPSYFWNTGISVWKVSKLLDLIKKHQPAHYAALEYVSEAFGTSLEASRSRESFKNLDHLSIENALFKNLTNMAAISVDLDWSDVGSWASVYDIQARENDNVTRGSVVTLKTDNCLIYAQKHLIATLGISNLVIVETDDVILIADKNDSEGLKKLHAVVKKNEGKKYI